MNVTFYSNTADERRVDKTNYLTQTLTKSGVTLLDTTSIMTPSIRLEPSEGEDLVYTLNNSNYAYIGQLGNYYYITDIETERGYTVVVHLKLDVLMSNKTDIKNLTCVIARQEKQYNSFLNDNEMKIYNYPRLQFKKFPGGFSKNLKYILALGGGR